MPFDPYKYSLGDSTGFDPGKYALDEELPPEEEELDWMGRLSKTIRKKINLPEGASQWGLIKNMAREIPGLMPDFSPFETIKNQAEGMTQTIADRIQAEEMAKLGLGEEPPSKAMFIAEQIPGLGVIPRTIDKGAETWYENPLSNLFELGILVGLGRGVVKGAKGRPIEAAPKAKLPPIEEMLGLEKPAPEAPPSPIPITQGPKDLPIANELWAVERATKLHKASYGLKPKNSLQRLLEAKQILDDIKYPKDRELYLENERLIGNYKNQLGVEPTTPSSALVKAKVVGEKPKGNWRELFDKTTDTSRKADILRAIVDISKSDKELIDVLDRVRGLPEEGNITWAVSKNPSASAKTAQRASSVRSQLDELVSRNLAAEEAAKPATETAGKQPWEMTREEYRDLDSRWVDLVEKRGEVKKTGNRATLQALDRKRSELAQEIYANHYNLLLDAAKRGEKIPGESLNNQINKIQYENSDVFKKKFGDSKVVNSEGRPLLLYHGSRLSRGRLGFNEPDGIGAIYFSDEPVVAQNFSRSGKPNEAYLRIENPLTVNAGGLEAGSNPEFIRHWWKIAKDKGHDGLIIKSIHESGFRGTDYLIKDKSQIIPFDSAKPPRFLKTEYPDLVKAKPPVEIPSEKVAEVPSEPIVSEQAVKSWADAGYTKPTAISAASIEKYIEYSEGHPGKGSIIPWNIRLNKEGMRLAGRDGPYITKANDLHVVAEKILSAERVASKLPVEPKIAPTLEGGESGIIGLNKAEQNRIRKDLGRTEIADPVKRKAFEESKAEAVQSKFDENALSIADEVIRSQRPITDAEHAGMVLKAAYLKNEYKAKTKTINDLIEKGDTKAAELERARRDVTLEQVDRLTEGARLGRREAARAMSIGRMMVDQGTYDLASVVQEAQASKGAKLTPEQHTRFESLTKRYTELEAKLKEIEINQDALLAEREKAMALRMAKRENRRAKVTEKSAMSRQRILSDRENIKKQLTKMGFRVNDVSGITTEGAYLVGKLATTYIKEGALTLSEVVQKVLIDLPELTERDVYHSLAMKNPKLQAKARADVTQRVARLKAEAKLHIDIENAEKGIFDPKRTKPIRPAEIRELQKKYRELRNRAYRSQVDASRLETALNKINELQDQLDNQYRTIRNGKTVDPPELAAAKEKAREIRSAMHVEDELARLTDQLRTGEFEVREKPQQKVLLPELERKQIELKRVRRQIRDAINNMAPMTAKKMGVEVINTARTLKATADMSATFRQGLVGTLRLATTDPVKLGKIFGKSVKAFFDEYTAEQVDNSIRSAPYYYIIEKSKLFLAELGGGLLRGEEMFAAKGIEKVPGPGAVVRASNRHMTTYLNMVRVECFLQYLRKYPNATHAELSAWADFINVASGRGNLNPGVAKALSTFIFAPRFSMSRVQTPYMFFKYLKEPRVRAEIAKDMVTTAGLGATALMLADMAGAEVGLDPREADFGKIKIGDTRIDLWGGFQQPIRVVARIGLSATDRAGLTGKDLSDREKSVDPVELISRFSSYKLAPSVTIPRELITGKTAVGEPVTPLETAAKALVPLIYEDIYDAYRREGAKQAAMVGGLTFFGVGANTYKDRESRVRRDIKRLIGKENSEGAYQKLFEWNAENPDNQITIQWFNKLLMETEKP